MADSALEGVLDRGLVNCDGFREVPVLISPCRPTRLTMYWSTSQPGQMVDDCRRGSVDCKIVSTPMSSNLLMGCTRTPLLVDQWIRTDLSRLARSPPSVMA